MSNGRTTGSVAGGLIAGLALSAMMLLGEKLSGKPSELIELERSAAAKLDMDIPPDGAPATATEQLITHCGHLALSTLAGLTYAAVVNDGSDNARSGAAFGFSFFLAAYGIIGPALGVTPLPWRQPPLRAVQHPVVHVLFGLAMARFARNRTRWLSESHSPHRGS